MNLGLVLAIGHFGLEVNDENWHFTFSILVSDTRVEGQHV